MVDQTGIDAASEREALDAPLSPVGTPRLKPKAEGVVDQTCASWNQLTMWLRAIGQLRDVA